MSPEEEEKVRLNAEIKKKVKTRLDVFCAKECMKIYEVTEMALEYFLDEHESQS